MMELDAQVRLRVDSKDEIGDLKEQINSLYQHLLTVIADLHDKNEAILQLEKMKIEFLRGASHELKTPLASRKILISAFVIGFVMQVFMFAVMLTYFILADKISFDSALLPQLVCLMLLNSLLASLLNALVVPYFKSVNSLGQYSTVIGAASGFLVGTYIPIGTLPSLAQNLMKLTPSTYMASLFRQVLMKDSLTEVFAGQGQLQQDFEKLLGIRIEWQKLLTSQETYYIVGVALMAATLFWLGQNWLLNRRMSFK